MCCASDGGNASPGPRTAINAALTSCTDDRRSKFTVGKSASIRAISVARTETIIRPVCGAIAVQEKCKVICHRDICCDRMVLNY
jgi:hypothetical protein